MAEKTYCPKCGHRLDEFGVCYECGHGEEAYCFAEQKRRFKQITDTDLLEFNHYWRYRYGCSPECEAEHKALDGLVLRADDIWWADNYPWGCKCDVDSLSKYDLKRDGLKLGTPPQTNYYEWIKPRTKEKYQIPLGVHWPKAYVKGVAIYQQVALASQQKVVMSKSKSHTKKKNNGGCLSTIISFIIIIFIIVMLWRWLG